MVPLSDKELRDLRRREFFYRLRKRMEDSPMSLGLAYWIIMLIWFVFGLYITWGIGSHFVIGSNLLLFILFGLLGWKVFGAPLHG